MFNLKVENKFYQRCRYGLLLGFTLLTGCASYQQFQYLAEEYEVPSKIFPAEYALTWQSVLDVMRRYPLEKNDQESGILKTRWIDNTLEVNFADSFGTSDAVKAARFKLVLNVTKGFKGSREVSKVTIYKRQVVEQDFLQGWKQVPSDGITEKTLLYRVEQVLKIEKKLKELEDQRSKEEEANF